jgi:hypothetical protein
MSGAADAAQKSVAERSEIEVSAFVIRSRMTQNA